MRIARALARLLLALVFVTAAVAQVHAVAAGAGRTMSHEAHAVAGGVADHAAMGHGPSEPEAPVHKPDACQTACCFALAPMPIRAGAASPVSFSLGIRYLDLVQPLSGRICSPDPGVPKRA